MGSNKQTTSPKASLPSAVTAIIFLAAFVLLALSLDGGAQAQGGTVLAIDVGDVGGNSSSTVGAINQCFEVSPGATYRLDVVILNGAGVVSAGLILNYQGAVTDRSISDSILNNESPDIGESAAIDEISTELPDSSGSDHVIVSNDEAFGSGGASGSGILIRFTMTAPTEPGNVTLGLAGALGPDPVLNDSQAHLVLLTHQGATLAVGTKCPATPSASPSSPTTAPQQSPSPGGSPGVTPSASASPSSPGASPLGSPSSGQTGGDTGGGLPLAAWIGIGVAGGALALGGALLALNPGLRRRLWRRS